jgi:predicted  nucleic acid-binding Zn-ribbon protein
MTKKLRRELNVLSNRQQTIENYFEVLNITMDRYVETVGTKITKLENRVVALEQELKEVKENGKAIQDTRADIQH